MYTYQQVYKATKEYFYGNELLTDIWISKYTLKDKQGNYYELTPDERIKAIIKELTRIELSYDSKLIEEEVYDSIYNLLKDFKYFIPGGSILYGLGNKKFLSSLGNCFVIGNEVDSYGSICKIDEEQVQLMKRRGGVGHDLSHLRPKGVPVNGCANTSTGSVSFAPRYSNSTREVAQDGRRGALMLTHHINHPDIIDFIVLKDDTTKVTGANISVKVTDKFMEEVLGNQNHEFKFPIDSNNVYSVINAKKLFEKLIHQAWKNGEPGVLFWDKIIKESPADCYSDLGYRTMSTNPCGELPLSPYDSCRLGHINLFAYILNPFTSEAVFDQESFERDVMLVQRIMDDIIDLEREKIDKILEQIETSLDSKEARRTEKELWEKIRQTLINGRRTGVGMLGEADAVAALGFTYASEKANDFIINAHRILALKSYESSIFLAKERGCFPVWDYVKEVNNPFINRILNEFNKDYSIKKGEESSIIQNYKKYGRRSIANLTIAPTGTTAQIINREGVSSGIEPVFDLFYKRRKKINPNDVESRVDFIDEVGDKWQEYFVIHSGFKKWYKINYPLSKSLEECSEQELEHLISKSPYHKATVNEINVISKIKLQGQVQRWVDHSISVTHNLPKETTEEQVKEFFIESWKSGCKGVTVYRDGSRAGVLIKNKIEESEEIFSYIDAKPRPEVLNCEIHRLQSRGQYFFVLVGMLSGNPYEIFVIEEKQFPSCLRIASSQILKGQIVKRKSKIYDLLTYRPDNNEPIFIKDIVSLMSNDDDRTDTKRFSLELRHRISPKEIAETIEKSCGDITAFDKAIARVLRKYIKEGEVSSLVCSKCGSNNMTYSGGCLRCKDCGDSKCS